MGRGKMVRGQRTGHEELAVRVHVDEELHGLGCSELVDVGD